MSKRPRKRTPAARSASRTTPASSVWVADWTLAPLWLLVLAVPLVAAPSLQVSFRLPKLLVASVLVAASFATLAWRLRRVERVDLRAFVRRPVVLASGLLLIAAGLGLVTSQHPIFVRQGFVYFALAMLALAVWEAALEVAEMRRLLAGLVVAGGILALVGILQHHDLVQPFPLFEREGTRQALTSFAGGPFDLATFLVLPILVLQGMLARRASRRVRWFLVGLLVVMLYALALAQTFSALAAVAIGSAMLWAQLVSLRRALVLGTGAAVLAAALAAAVPALRQRVVSKLATVRQGDLNTLVTGRLDGWRAGLWMIEQRPLFGVGHGAYRAEFAAARLALVAEGVPFYRRQQRPFFENPHSDLLAAVVNWGLVGAGLLAVALGLLARAMLCAWRAWRAEGEPGKVDAAVASALLAAVLLQTSAAFPLHLAMVAYPFLLVPAAIFRRAREAIAAS